MRVVTALALATGCGFSPSAPTDAASVKPLDAADAFVPDAVPADLIAWYPMDDTSLHDATGHGHDGACAACPTQADGVIDHALAFANARVDVAGSPDLQPGEGTIAAWIELDSAPGGYACPLGQIITQPMNGNTWQLCLYQMQFWQVFLTTSTATPSFTAGAQIVLGEWQHVAITWTASTVELFIGGVSKGMVGITPLKFDGNTMTLGGDRNAPDQLDSTMTGRLDDVRLYSRALSQPELAALAVH